MKKDLLILPQLFLFGLAIGVLVFSGDYKVSLSLVVAILVLNYFKER